MTAFVPFLAHAFGKRYDLPGPLWLYVVGGAVVVFVSFLLVLPTRVRAPAQGPALRDGIALRAAAPVRMALAWLLFIALAVGGWIGSQALAENILATAFWLLVWIVVPISCGLIGDWTRPVNPFAAVARLCDRDSARRALLGSERRVDWPRRAGYWPATVLFFIVASGELIYNGTATLPAVTATAIVAYMALNAVAGVLVGSEIWLERGELFSVLWSTWGRLGWWRFGAPGRRGFLGGLIAPFEVSTSRITFVLLLLVSVSFDGVLATPGWKQLVTKLPDALLPGTSLYLVFETLAFLLLVAFAWLLFGGFAAAVRAAGRINASSLQVLAGLMRSLLPISFGYLVAHNADYIAINGQLLIPILGNPFGMNGVHLLPAPFNDSYEVNPNILPSSVLWYGEVVLIIAVHVAAVFLAHQYLGRTLRAQSDARRAEWPWIIVMVGYTMTSLWLLAQPVVKESTSSKAAAAAATHAVINYGVASVASSP